MGNCNCKCVKRVALCAVLLAAVAAAVVFSRGRGKADAAPPPAAEEEPEPVSFEERAQRKIDERMNDGEYVGGLNALAAAQGELARRREAAQREFADWRSKFVEGSVEARELVKKFAALGDADSAEAADLRARLQSLIDADAVGARLQGVIAEIDAEAERARAAAAEMIGARIHRQAGEGMKAEQAEAEAARRRRIASGELAPATNSGAIRRPPAGGREISPRGSGWWTNGVPAAAAVPAPAPAE